MHLNLSGVLKKLASSVIEVRYQPPIPGAKPIVWKNPRYQDGFDPKPKPQVPGTTPPPPNGVTDADYVRGLYKELLGREPDPDGFKAHLGALAGGATREQVRQVFLDSPEYAAKQNPQPPPPPAVPTPAPAPTPPAPPPVVLKEPGAPLATVPLDPKYVGAPIDKSSDSAAVISAARWVKDNHPELFARAADRQVDFEIMTWLIGALRVAGYDAHRVVNHPSFPMGAGMRYGSDAIVLNGDIYDCYRGIGDPNQNVPQAMNAGKYEAGRLRE